ncbi:MAG: hypothetical protein KC413_01025 [Anaerolineales bacterium]|nr:hypothetical protein [Anaerolineales bacterium]MCA9974292.1 hypothetical protein [Anaerolineales bacterium]MCB8966211.1 hypothetical protein [Ardenticatenaceae bacterium]
MSPKTDLELLRKKAYFSYHEDGLLDLMIGLSILGFGLDMAADNAAFLVASWIWVVVYMPLKNRITFPRLGYVRFDDEQDTKKRLLLLLVIGVVVGLLFFGMVVFESQDSLPVSFANWLRTYHMMLIGGLFALPLLGAWLWTAVHRFWIYAVLLEVLIYVGIQIGLEPAVYTMLPGGVIALLGLVFLLRFLHKYPVLAE